MRNKLLRHFFRTLSISKYICISFHDVLSPLPSARNSWMLFQGAHNLTAKKTERRMGKRNAALKGKLVVILKVEYKLHHIDFLILHRNVRTSSVSEKVSLTQTSNISGCHTGKTALKLEQRKIRIISPFCWVLCKLYC